jgi:microcystin-dependent protein
MASSYSDLKIELIGTGEQSGSWGTTTNTNLGTAIEEAIAESVDVSFSSGTVTLTLTNSNATQSARHLRLNLTGTSGGAQNLVVPTIEKPYLVNNGTADTITVKTSGGSGIGVPSGKTMWVYVDGTNVVDAVTALSSLKADGGVTVDNITIDGTEIDLSSGDLTLDVAGDIVLDAAGDEVIFKDGSTNVGHVSMDSDNLTIKSLVSDKDVIFQGNDGGSGNSTPDLRDRFVVGAGSTYSVDATGGSATVTPSGTNAGTALSESQLPAHNHTTTITFTNGTTSSSSSTRLAGGGATTLGTQTYDTDNTGSGATHTHTFTGDSQTNLPPYYALAYIMKT